MKQILVFGVALACVLCGAMPARAQEPLTYGGAYQGELTEADSAGERGNYFKRYPFAGESGDEIEIRMTSDNFDAYLELRASDETLLAMDDDGAGNLNPLIRYTLPASGMFYIDATSYAGGFTGAFALSLLRMGDPATAEPAPAPPGVAAEPPAQAPAEAPVQAPAGSSGPVPIAYGQTFGGLLETSDPVREDYTYYDEYVFQGRAGDMISATLSSIEFDPYLYLLDSAGDNVAANDDNGAAGWDAAIALTLPVDGPYILRANSLSAGDTGAYTLALNISEAAAEPDAAPSPPVPRAANSATPVTTLDPVLSEFFFGSSAISETGQSGSERPAGNIDFGSDDSDWSNNGICDDPRFEGPGVANVLNEIDLRADATDCRNAYRDGRASLR